MPDSEQVLPIGHENKPVCGAAFVPGSAQNEPTGPASLLLLNANHSSPLRRRTRWSQAAVFRLSLAPSLRCFCSSPSLVRFAREPCRPSTSQTRRAHLVQARWRGCGCMAVERQPRSTCGTRGCGPTPTPAMTCSTWTIFNLPPSLLLDFVGHLLRFVLVARAIIIFVFHFVIG